VPRPEPRSRYGNPPFYDVFGKRYFVLPTSAGYVERGIASWYGPGFHEVRTSTGEPYDMYGMTAAHKTLPLPAYVRVTNLQNGRSIVVRVNDRGPFVGNRIIDLSYTAAAKLDMLRNGTAIVEVRAIDPTAPESVGRTANATPVAAANPDTRVRPDTGANPMTGTNRATGPSPIEATNSIPMVTAPVPLPDAPASVPASPTPSATTAVANAANPAALPPPPGSPVSPPVVTYSPPASAALPPTRAPSPGTPAANGTLYIQAGAFANPANAERLAASLRSGNYGRVFVRSDQIGGRRLFRVRIGPVAQVEEFDRIVAALEHAGISDAHLALD
jgi:rare lipoprotein A